MAKPKKKSRVSRSHYPLRSTTVQSTAIRAVRMCEYARTETITIPEEPEKRLVTYVLT